MFEKRELVKTIELERLSPKGNANVVLSARIELFSYDNGLFGCNILFLEDYRVLPTEVVLSREESPILDSDYCDKPIYTQEVAMDFDLLLHRDLAQLEAMVFQRLDSMFFQTKDESKGSGLKKR